MYTLLYNLSKSTEHVTNHRGQMLLTLDIHRIGSPTMQIVAVQDTCYGLSIVGVMKVGNILPRVGIEPTYLAFEDNVPTILPARPLDLTILPTPICLCGSYPDRSVQTITLALTIFRSLSND